MPYKGIHVCVLKERDYDSYRVETCARKVDGKCIDHRYGLFKNEEGKIVSEISELWFREEDGWTEIQARSYCQEQDGEFEPALSQRHGAGGEAEGYKGGRPKWRKDLANRLAKETIQQNVSTHRRYHMIWKNVGGEGDLHPMPGEAESLMASVVMRALPKENWEDGKPTPMKPVDVREAHWLVVAVLEKQFEAKYGDEKEFDHPPAPDWAKKLVPSKMATDTSLLEGSSLQKARVIVNEMGIERRFVSAEVRVVEDSDGQPHIQGYGAVFDEWSVDLGGFRESIEPGAFSKTLREADVRSLWNHNPDYILGRNKSGSLRLFEDARGLGYDVIPPDAQWARDLMVSIKRGDVSQASFGFETLRDNWDQDEEGNVTRRLLEVKLFDVGPVTFAAYPQTSAEARSKAEEYQRSNAAPGPGPHPADADEDQARARLDVKRRRLDLLEIANSE